MRATVETALRQREASDWPGVETANMELHMAVVELADSERLNAMFAPVLTGPRLASSARCRTPSSCTRPAWT